MGRVIAGGKGDEGGKGNEETGRREREGKWLRRYNSAWFIEDGGDRGWQR